jgi:hypothetical protein
LYSKLLAHATTATADPQAHQSRRERSEVFHFPRVAIAQSNMRCWYQHAFVVSTAYIHFRIAEWIVCRTRSAAQFAKSHIALIKNRYLRPAVSLVVNDYRVRW